MLRPPSSTRQELQKEEMRTHFPVAPKKEIEVNERMFVSGWLLPGLSGNECDLARTRPIW